MTSLDMVTKFWIRKDWYQTPFGSFEYKAEALARCEKSDMGEAVITHSVEMASVEALIKALREYCEGTGLNADEYHFCLAPSIEYRQPAAPASEITVPEKYWRLIAFATEGGSEGYYVHVGAIVRNDGPGMPTYMDFGFAKTYDSDNAFALAKEAQRFLEAAQWN